MIVVCAAAGCNGNGNTTTTFGVSASHNTKTGTTVTASVSVTIKSAIENLIPSDFESSFSSGYTVIANVPSADFTFGTQNPVQATLTATTDTGFTSSTTVTLQPVTSTTAPIGSGYTVYTFAIPATSELNTWVQSVGANANSTMNLSATSTIPFNDLGTAGTYTFYIQINSSQTGVQPVGSIVYSDPGSGTPNPSCPPNKPCPVGGPQN